MRTLILLAFLWFGSGSPLTYTVSRNADPVVGVAVQMMQDDLQEVTGTRPQAVRADARLRIVQYDRERTHLKYLGVPAAVADSLRFVKEAFYVGTHGRQLVVVGSDARGTAYGVLEVSRLGAYPPGSGGAIPARRRRSAWRFLTAGAPSSTRRWSTAASSSTTRTGPCAPGARRPSPRRATT